MSSPRDNVTTRERCHGRTVPREGGVSRKTSRIRRCSEICVAGLERCLIDRITVRYYSVLWNRRRCVSPKGGPPATWLCFSVRVVVTVDIRVRGTDRRSLGGGRPIRAAKEPRHWLSRWARTDGYRRRPYGGVADPKEWGYLSTAVGSPARESGCDDLACAMPAADCKGLKSVITDQAPTSYLGLARGAWGSMGRARSASSV